MTHATDPHTQLLDDARQAAAVAARTQQRVLVDIGTQDATFVGSLEEVAETGTSIALDTTVGRRLHGAVRVLAADHLVLAVPQGTAWVRLDAITALRGASSGGIHPGGGDRPPRPRTAFADDLRGLVEDAADVEVVLDGGARVHGQAVAAGRDVLHVREATGGEVLLPLARTAVVVTTA